MRNQESVETRNFSWKELFTDAFSKHSEEELEQHWAAGTIGNIPSIENVNTGCPKPWAFVRVFGISLVTYLILLFCWNEFHPVNLLPGLIIVGTMAIPFSVLIFFFEMNVRRNVSMYLVAKLLVFGGVVALLYSLFMFKLTAALGLGWLGASVAGIAEESGKLLALMLVINRLRYPYMLNGLLFGAAIGAGFAIFESAGYALGTLVVQIIAVSVDHAAAIQQAAGDAAKAGGAKAVMTTLQTVFAQIAAQTDQGMINNIITRGLVSPFSHIIWTAMAAAGLWLVKGGRKFEAGMLLDMRFLRTFLAAVALHMVWNASWGIHIITPLDKHIILGIIGWTIIFHLVRQGLKQIAEEKANSAGISPGESGIMEVIQLQKTYTDNLVAAVRRPAENNHDHLGIAAEVRESKEHEQKRERPDFSNRAWKKYYSRNNRDGDQS